MLVRNDNFSVQDGMHTIYNDSVQVEVLMPVYNQAGFVARAIESVLRQKGNVRFRLRIGDDASDDTTGGVCTHYAHRYPDVIVYTRYETNQGLVCNYKRLLDSVGTEYVAILEGDDYWVDDYKLYKQLSYMEQHPTCNLSHSAANYLHVACNRVSLHKPFGAHGNIYAGLLRSHNNICAQTVMFRMSAFRQHVEFDYLLRRELLTVDYFIWLELAYRGEVHFLPDVTAVYRIHPFSVSNSSDVERQVSFYRTKLEIEEYYIRKYPVVGIDFVRSSRFLKTQIVKECVCLGEWNIARRMAKENGVYDFRSLKIFSVVVLGLGAKHYRRRLLKRKFVNLL